MTSVRRLSSSHDMTFGFGLTNIAVGAEALAQRVKTRLYLIQKEWFLDTDAGVPYIPRVVKKPVDLQDANGVLKRTILGTEGVLSLASYTFDLNHQTRKFSVLVSVNTNYGTNQTLQVTL